MGGDRGCDSTVAKADRTQRSPYARCTPITSLAAAEKGAAEGMLDGGVLKFIRRFLEPLPSVFSLAAHVHLSPRGSEDVLLNYVIVFKDVY